MIKLEFDPSDVRTLRITASYLLALAGDIVPEITGLPTRVENVISNISDKAIEGLVASGHLTPFNSAELSEAATIDKSPEVAFSEAPGTENPLAAGFTVAAEASWTVPSDTQVAISTQPPVAGLQPAASSDASGTVAALPTANPAGVEVDSKGLPWSPDIHSSGKSKMKSGEWTAKRGVTPELKAQVEANLRAALNAPLAMPTPQNLPSAAVAGVQPAAGQPAAAAITSATTASPSNGESPFVTLMKKVSKATTDKHINPDQFQGIIKAHGLNGVTDIASRMDLCDSISNAVDAVIVQNIAAGGLPA